MIDCPHCRASNREGSKFCGHCGRPLGAIGELICPMCDTRNPPGSSLCSKCGARLVLETAGPAEESPRLAEEEALRSEEAEGEEAVGDLEEAAPPERIEEAPAPAEEEPTEGMPPWLKKLQEAPPEEGPAEAEEVLLPPGELPEWLEIPPDLEEILSEVAPAREEEIAPAEIPAWLDALRPAEEEGAIEPGEVSDRAESKGLLRGIKGVLRIEPVLALPRRAEAPSPFAASALGDERAETFAAVVAEPARPKVEVARPSLVEGLLASTVRWMIYLIVAVAVIVPILLGSNWAADNMRVSAPTIAMYDAIEALPQDAVVLVSHDYDPGVAAEMIPQARVVLHHLMQRQVRLISVSLTPEGATLSRRIVEEAGQEHGYVYGDDYVNLGYVLGVEVGPRSLAEGFPGPGWTDIVERRQFSEFPAGSGVEDLGDIDLIVEFAGGAEPLRLWLEQVQSPYQVPMVAGVSATADPFARPYYHNEAQHQLLGLISGLVGAAEYELHSGRAGAALASMDSQSLAHIAIVLLVVFGNGAYFINRLRKG